jgi:hypothetical protein
MLSAIHFQGWSIRQVSCYTLLSGFQLPWPPSCCPNRPTPFMGSFGMHLGTLAERLVHPTSPVLLTRNGPLGALIVCKRHCTLAPTHSEFENRPKHGCPESSNHWLYRMELIGASYPEGHFGGNQLPDSSIGLSPLCPHHGIDLHVRTPLRLHPCFRGLHAVQA